MINYCLNLVLLQKKKTENDLCTDTEEPSNLTSFHDILIDSRILENILSAVGCCPLCKSTQLKFSNNISMKKGLANYIEITCTSCDYFYSTYSSNRIDKPKQSGPNPFDVNARSIIACRVIGKGHTAMETFFGYMNCTSPMAYCSFTAMNHEIASCYANVASESTHQAVREIRSENGEDEICDIGVSCDGTWQKRGYSSLNGIVTVISIDTGKAIDYEVMVKKCAQCTLWESRKGTVAYNEFMADQDNECLTNHKGSASMMEPQGVVSCFMRSLEKYKTRYTQYLGDGDTKSYLEVVKNDPYNGVPINKLECIGHIQKRVGARLIKMRKDGVFKDLTEDDEVDEEGGEVKRKKKKKNKKIKLTDKNINKLQNYYGIAIRSSTGGGGGGALFGK